MPIDSTHPSYDAMCSAWALMEDVLAGEDAVKNAGDKYLPRFAEGDEEDWAAYKERATFFEITSRALSAMNGFLYRKDPAVKLPGQKKGTANAATSNPTLQEFVRDTTLTGKSLYDVSKDLTNKVLSKARGGALIDWSDIEQQPYALLYAAEDIINWRYERINGRMMLTMVMLHERDTTYYSITGEDPPDEYEMVEYDQWRELRLEPDGLGGYFYSSTVWRRRKPAEASTKSRKRGVLKGTGPAPGAGVAGDEDFVQIDYIIPQRRNQTLQEIPFVFCTSKGPDGNCVPKPPLYGMAKQNIKHYRLDADYSNLLHVLGMPTPYAFGVTSDEADALYLGSSTAWTSDKADAKAGFVALTGSEVAPLEEGLQNTERRMAELGARMLDAQMGGAAKMPEAFQTVALRQTGETSVLMDISLSLTQSMQDVVAWALWWTQPPSVDRQAAEDQVGYTLNTDFLGGVMDPQMFTALMSAYLKHTISFETFFAKLQAGEIIPPDVTIEEEKKRIEEGKESALQDQITQMQLQMEMGGKPPPNKQKKQAEE